jgi:hypothetical protein
VCACARTHRHKSEAHAGLLRHAHTQVCTWAISIATRGEALLLDFYGELRRMIGGDGTRLEIIIVVLVLGLGFRV